MDQSLPVLGRSQAEDHALFFQLTAAFVREEPFYWRIVDRDGVTVHCGRFNEVIGVSDSYLELGVVTSGPTHGTYTAETLCVDVPSEQLTLRYPHKFVGSPPLSAEATVRITCRIEAFPTPRTVAEYPEILPYANTKEAPCTQ